MAGAHVAGESGMHALGSTLIGCTTALGGGTFNHVVTGASRPVAWAINPSMLGITIGGSLVGFYVWPVVEEEVRGRGREREAFSREKDGDHCVASERLVGVINGDLTKMATLFASSPSPPGPWPRHAVRWGRFTGLPYRPPLRS